MLHSKLDVCTPVSEPGVCLQLNRTSKTMEYSGKVRTSLPLLWHGNHFRHGFHFLTMA